MLFCAVKLNTDMLHVEGLLKGRLKGTFYSSLFSIKVQNTKIIPSNQGIL